MASSVNLRNKQDIYEAYDSPLFEACLLVAKSRRIDLKPPTELMRKKASAITLDEIIKVSNVNSREVLLEDRWWENDVGSLLGYMNQDGRPVAIIAVNSHSYIVYDVTNGSRFKVTAKNAKLLKPQAIMFYRPFPYKKLTLKDIAIFGYENVWKLDIWIFIGIGLLGTVFGMITPKPPRFCSIRSSLKAQVTS